MKETTKRFEIGCCSPIEYYELIADSGFDYIDILGWQLFSLTRQELSNFLALTKRIGLPCTRISGYCRKSPAIVGENYDPVETREYARVLCGRAAILGVEYIGIGSPLARVLPDNYSKSIADEQCAEFLAATAEEAGKYGIQILFEAIHPGFCNYLNSTAECYSLIKQLSIPNLHLVLDLYHMKRNGESIYDIGKYLDEIRYIHISTDLGGTKRGLYTAQDVSEAEETCSVIKRSGYTGCISFEPDTQMIVKQNLKEALGLARFHLEENTNGL